MTEVSINEIKKKKYKNKFYYFKRQTKESDNYYIFKLIKIENNEIYIKYGYMFSVKENINRAYLYDLKDFPIPFEYVKKIYVLSDIEFHNTYFKFLEYDCSNVSELPEKLIQDIV